MTNERGGSSGSAGGRDPNGDDKTNNGLGDGRRDPGSNHGSPDDREGDGRRNGSESGGGKSQTKD
ncbi:hypothetical protein DEDE109153_13730 [Deinococcus deserti]|uniref:Uncharacterized protein n=1 Tax=Deinococcus deserti (strain DSM 17065 / CIP 109153 / LMG 22923 / VCD115) TaxID=546414 RepID=C1D2X6_DEIDV|nr:hypothetical protein [Deinococcus deserti]ACO47765.1 hypothetical protein Deide_2p00980 [Deinococcus deserti VCD115]